MMTTMKPEIKQKNDPLHDKKKTTMMKIMMMTMMTMSMMRVTLPIVTTYQRVDIQMEVMENNKVLSTTMIETIRMTQNK